MTTKLRGSHLVDGDFQVDGRQLASVGVTKAIPASAEVVAEAVTLAPAQRHTFTVTALALVADEADGFGSVEVADLPDGVLVQAHLEGTFTKDGTGYIDTSAVTVALGTAAASADPLADAMANVISAALATDALATEVDAVTAQLSSPAPLYLEGSTLYLNASGATETGENGAISFTGTIVVTILPIR